MKKTLSLLVALVILLSLCACGNEPTSDTTNPSQETSTSIDEISTDTTESTQTTDVEETTVSTEAPATTPSEENITKPTEKPIEPTKPVHIHSYAAATCTQAKKCSCGATSGSALGHKWTNATCSTSKTCSVCKTTEGNATGHSWSDATCTAPKTCKTCKASEGSAAGHSYKEATCKMPKTCTKCGGTEGEILPHSYQDGKCNTCNRRQLGVGRWAAFSLERNEYIGTDLDVIWIDSARNLIGMYSYIDMETIDPELLKDLQQMDSSIVTYQGKQYIEYAGLGDGIYYENISEESITVCVFDSTEKFTLKRLSDTQVESVDVVGCDWCGIKAGMIFVYKD